MSNPEVNRLAKMGWSARTKIRPHAGRGKPFHVDVRGTYGVRIVDQHAFQQSMDRAGACSTDEVQRALEALIKRRLRATIRNAVESSDQVDAYFGAVAQETRLGVKHQFSRMGIDLVDFLVTSVRSSGDEEPAPRQNMVPAKRRSTAALHRPRVGRAAELRFPRRRG